MNTEDIDELKANDYYVNHINNFSIEHITIHI